MTFGSLNLRRWIRAYTLRLCARCASWSASHSLHEVHVPAPQALATIITLLGRKEILLSTSLFFAPATVFVMNAIFVIKKLYNVRMIVQDRMRLRTIVKRGVRSFCVRSVTRRSLLIFVIVIPTQLSGVVVLILNAMKSNRSVLMTRKPCRPDRGHSDAFCTSKRS